MGRYSKGTWTTYECRRLELSYLIRQGLIQRNKTITASISWHDNRGNQTGNIGIKTVYNDLDCYIDLMYQVTDGDGRKDYNYRIQLFRQFSNLGFGEVLYFGCPYSFKKCRILYMAYGSHRFLCRTAYRNRLYYDCQIASKLSRYNDSYWRIEKHIDKMQASTIWKRSFKGKPTKAARRYKRLCEKHDYYDTLRWSALAMPLSVRKAIGGS